MSNIYKYPLAKDTIDMTDLKTLANWLTESGVPYLAMGEITRKFEKKWSNWLGINYSIACNSGSSANLLMFATLLESNLLKNKKVIVPATGWVTTVAPAIQLGFEPIMCGTDQKTFGLNLEHLEHLLKDYKPSTVIAVHTLGIPGEIERLQYLKSKYNFFLLEDCCAAVGSAYKENKVGVFGDMSSFSLYFGHQISTIEGGLVSTNNKLFRDLMLMIRSHGWDKDLDNDKKLSLSNDNNVNTEYSPFIFYLPGYNLRITDLQSFIGLRQIDKIDWVVKQRNENHLRYMQRLDNILIVQKPSPQSIVASIHFVAIARETRERNIIVDALNSNSIETRLFTAGNLGRHPFWIKRFGHFSCLVADKLFDCGFFLPNYPLLEKSDIDFISDVIKKQIIEYRKENS